MQREADGANTRWNPWERRITAANVASLQPVWSRHLVSRRPSQPLIAGGHMYVSRSGLATCPPLASLSVPSATHMAVGEGHLLVTSPTTTAGTYQITALAPTSP